MGAELGPRLPTSRKRGDRLLQRTQRSRTSRLRPKDREFPAWLIIIACFVIFLALCFNFGEWNRTSKANTAQEAGPNKPYPVERSNNTVAKVAKSNPSRINAAPVPVSAPGTGTGANPAPVTAPARAAAQAPVPVTAPAADTVPAAIPAAAANPVPVGKLVADGKPGAPQKTAVVGKVSASADAGRPAAVEAAPPATNSGPAGAPPPGLEEPPPGLFIPGAPLDSVNPAGANFDVSSINPTSFQRPPHGFPPRNLPLGHSLRPLLREIRQRTQLHPRWPKYPEAHVQALKTYGPAYASIIFSEKLKVVYVPVFKVGTTSMMWNIAYLENISSVVNANMSDPAIRDYLLHDMNLPAWSDRVLIGMSRKRVRQVLNNPEYLKFGFVRNPYHRVVSAYLDKVVKWDFNSMEYQTQMYGLYGEDTAMRKLRNTTKPTFKEFIIGVERVISMPRTKTTLLRLADSYEDNNSRRDLHWRPQVELLHPDLIHFDFIGRFGRMDEDKKHVLKWMYKHTDRRLPTGRRRMHSTNPKDKVGLFKLLREDVELKNRLVKAYKVDFDRFGFSTEIPPVNEHM